LFYKPIAGLWTPKYKALRWPWELLALSIAVQVLVFPLVIYYFHQFPLWCLVANIPAALFSFVLMLGALLLFACSAIGHCAWLGHILVVITNTFHNIIGWMARFTPRSFRELYMDTVDCWILMTAIILLSAYCFNKKSRYLLAGLSVLCLLLISFIIQDIRHSGQQKLVVYNTPGQTMIDRFTGKADNAL
jgi:competence protein ComEC